MTVDPLTPSPAPRVWYRSLILALTVLAVLMGSLLLYTRFQNPHNFLGTAYPANTPAPALTGTGEDGQPLALSDLKGRTVAVFFGFLHCPNICPTTLASLERVRQTLPVAQREQFVSLLVSVDPNRDTPQKMREYVTYFSSNARGLVIPSQNLAAAAAAWGVGYQYAPVTASGDYDVGHTTGVYLIDPQGHRRVVWDYSQLNLTDRIGQDVRAVLK